MPIQNITDDIVVPTQNDTDDIAISHEIIIKYNNNTIVFFIVCISLIFFGICILISSCILVNNFILSEDTSSTDNIQQCQILDIENSTTIIYEDFQLSFNNKYRLSNYAFYIMNSLNVPSSSPSPIYHSGSIRHRYINENTTNTTITLNTYPLEAYEYSGFEMAHLVSPNDIQNTNSSYVMTNIVPQFVCFNLNLWRPLNTFIESTYQNHYIMTAVDFNDMTDSIVYENLSVVDYESYTNILNVPSGFYKIIFDENFQFIKSIYLKHTTANCNEYFIDIAIYDKIPDYIKC